MKPITMERPTDKTSKNGNDKCLCGVDNCTGHEVIDGKVSIPQHPHGHIVVHVDENKS